MNQDDRRFARIAMDSHVAISCDGHCHDSRLIDISLNGALFQRPADWTHPQGTLCQLTVTLAGTDIAIQMEGSVAHIDESRIGLHCEHIDVDSISHLKRLVELNLGDEAELERELRELARGN